MTPQEFDELMTRTLDDGRLSRGERKALAARLEDSAPGTHRLFDLRARVFAAARERLGRHEDRELLGWVEDMVKVLAAARPSVTLPAAEALFSPGIECRGRIVGLVQAARDSVDICVFTVTDNEITDALLAAHARGVALRVLTDDLKAGDRGSDITALERAGVPVAIDTSDKHMHHKFAVFDQRAVLTGSYNWTRSAAEHNEENIVVVEDTRLVHAFTAEFDALWSQYRV